MKVGDRVSEFRVSSSVKSILRQIRIVDLAGSEKFKIPGGLSAAEQDIRIQEVTCINGSLSSLGHCISVRTLLNDVGFNREVAHAHSVPELEAHPHPERQSDRERQAQTHNMHIAFSFGRCRDILHSAVRQQGKKGNN
jgi:hypothetical protein